MGKTISIVGIILIIAGILALGYQGFTYTKQEKVAEVGNVQITADTQKSVHFSPFLGGSVLLVGVVLVVVGRMQAK